MEEQKNEVVKPCCCGEPWVIVVKVRPGVWIAACKSCACHVYGATEKEVRKKWNEEVAHRD